MHSCDAIVVSCIDFRFQKFIRDWTDKNLANETFDYVGFAGCTKDLETALKQIEISIRLHNVKKVILMHHEECGAYGTESTPENHARDLKKAKAKILEQHPDITVELYYLHLNGDFEKVE